MEILHGIQDAVEIVHGPVHLMTGAIRVREVKGPLEESRLAFQASQAPVNSLGQGVCGHPLQQPSQSLGQVSLAGGPIEMPQLVEEVLPECGVRAAPIPDFNHLMEKAQNPDDTRK